MFRCVFCHKRNGAIQYFTIEEWTSVMSRQKQVFCDEGILKSVSTSALTDGGVPACKSHLVLKSSGTFRLVSLPIPFSTRFRQPGGLADFLRFLHDQVPFVFSPTLLSVRSAFAALSDFRALFPVDQRQVNFLLLPHIHYLH
uniref:Uncharacterized protein n=1 Tax=Mesocestoides corti TaxID=53468 RepID=A0A5K3FAX2_MESCO